MSSLNRPFSRERIDQSPSPPRAAADDHAPRHPPGCCGFSRYRFGLPVKVLKDFPGQPIPRARDGLDFEEAWSNLGAGAPDLGDHSVETVVADLRIAP